MWRPCHGGFSCHNSQALTRGQGRDMEDHRRTRRLEQRARRGMNVMPLHSQNSWRDGFQVGQGHLRSPHIPISLTRKKRNCNNNQSPFAECAPCARSCVRFFSSFRNAVTETSATSRRWQNRSTSHCKIYQLNLLRPLLSADETGIMLLTSQGGVRSTHDKPSLWKHLAPCPALASA